MVAEVASYKLPSIQWLKNYFVLTYDADASLKLFSLNLRKNLFRDMVLIINVNITRLLPMNGPRGAKGKTRDTNGEMG